MSGMLILLFTAALSIAFGIFLIQRPLSAFECQRRFYRLINWDIKPISVEKEIRNTKWMGIFLLAAAVAAVIYRSLRG
jgi:hypothetical protein